MVVPFLGEEQINVSYSPLLDDYVQCWPIDRDRIIDDATEKAIVEAPVLLRRRSEVTWSQEAKETDNRQIVESRKPFNEYECIVQCTVICALCGGG